MPAWSHKVTLDGVDITADTLGGTSVDEAENVSHVADLRWRPATGIQDPDGLIGKTLKIDVDVGGGLVSIFTGNVIRATWEQRTRIYNIRGSNRIQEHFRAMGTHAAVLAALPGAAYSEALFGEPPDDLWEYAQRCLETLEQDCHIDRTAAQALIPWAAKVTPDHTLSIVHNAGTFDLQRPDLDETVNEVVITYQYRVSRWKTRTHGISWSSWRNNTPITDWCSWYSGTSSVYQFEPAQVTLLNSTLLGSSWSVPGGLNYTTAPESAGDVCGTGIPWSRPDAADLFAFTASVDGYRSWSQPITETYTLTVSATAAQGVYGTTVTDARSGSLSVESDPSWPPDDAQPPDPAWNVDAIGDAYQDQEDETARANDLQAGYQWAARRIRAGLRATSLVVRHDLDPTITLADTVEVQAYGLRAKGKARRLRYVLESAAPYLELTLALSRGAGGTTTPWSVPARPDTTDPGYPAPPSATTLNTIVGNWPGAGHAPVPDERLGWITNVVSWICTGQPGSPCPEPEEIYDPAFRCEWPEVEDEAAAERTEDVPSAWELEVDNDLLELT